MRSYRLGLVVIGIVNGIILLLTQTNTIYGGDAGDLVSAIVTRGIPHPPGYPIYTLFGILLNESIKIFSPAWRVSFLSSIPLLISLFFLYDLFCQLTKRWFFSLITVVCFAFLYPVWLYAIVPEVFSLNTLFLVVLLWSSFKFDLLKQPKYLLLCSYVFGLALTHHHIILFIAPVVFLIFWNNRKIIRKKTALWAGILFLLGLLPYTYVFISASHNPGINWLGDSNLTNFIALVSRTIYGSFQAGKFITNLPITRLINLAALGIFVYQDFRFIGIIFIITGFLFGKKVFPSRFKYIGIGLVSYLFFLFYASFPIANSFMLATFERFIQPIYLLLMFVLLSGFIGLSQALERMLKRMIRPENRKFILALTSLVFIIYPVALLRMNYPKLSVLKNDKTAESIGEDILTSLPAGSLLILTQDTPIFNTQYMYYSELTRWKNIKIIHGSKLLIPAYSNQVKVQYPDITLPGSADESSPFISRFVSDNKDKFIIFGWEPLQTNQGLWVPWGLLFRYYPEEKLSDDLQKSVVTENNRLWTTYQNPEKGSLSIYHNLFLDESLRIYSEAHKQYAVWAGKNKLYEIARDHAEKAYELNNEDTDPLLILIQVDVFEKKCDDAKALLVKLRTQDPNNSTSDFFEAMNYKECYHDDEKAKEYEDRYRESEHKEETPLKQL